MDIQKRKPGRPKKNSCTCNGTCKKDKTISVVGVDPKDVLFNENVKGFTATVNPAFEEPIPEAIKELISEYEKLQEQQESKVERLFKEVSSLTDEEFVQFIEFFEQDLYKRTGVKPILTGNKDFDLEEDEDDEEDDDDEDDLIECDNCGKEMQWGDEVIYDEYGWGFCCDECREEFHKEDEESNAEENGN